jgi:serine-type D-Ala-D-Ala carboxypeptidase/endopeptidase
MERTLIQRIPYSALALIILLPLLGCAVRHEGGRADPQQLRDGTIRSNLVHRVAMKQSAGLVVGMANRDTSRFVSYGTFNGPGTPSITENTLFEIGSVTKVFTATVLADMVARGEVALEDPVARYLPSEGHLPSRNGKEITLLDLATHTSGLPRFPANMTPADSANPFADYTEEQLYAFLSSYVLPRNPGEEYEYSNLGMALLGHALARRAGKPYEALVVDRVLTPLKMQDTRISLTPALQLRFTPGHDASLALQRPWDLPTLAGSGAFRSTARDMMRFLAAYSRPLGTPFERLAPLALEPRRSAGSASVTVGLGWHIIERNGARFAGVNGQTGGYAAFASFDASTGSRVVVLSNSARSIDDIGWHILDPSSPLQTSFAPAGREIVLDASELDRFVGQYGASPADVIAITREGDSLWARVAGLKYQLFAEGRERFFLKAVDARIAFTADASGDVTSLTLRYGDAEFTAPKMR